MCDKDEGRESPKECKLHQTNRRLLRIRRDCHEAQERVRIAEPERTLFAYDRADLSIDLPVDELKRIGHGVGGGPSDCACPQSVRINLDPKF